LKSVINYLLGLNKPLILFSADKHLTPTWTPPWCLLSETLLPGCSEPLQCAVHR